MIKTKATLKPGQNGTKRLTEKYGERLLCVRYKYDKTNQKRYLTVELIEEEIDWVESPGPAQVPAPVSSERLAVRVEYWENQLREKVKTAGGIWRPRQRVWELGYESVVALGLESRVVGEDSSVL